MSPRAVVALLIVLAPALACAAAVWLNAVDVPVADDWARAELLEPGSVAGSFSMDAPLPRWVASVNARFFSGDLRLEMALGFCWVLVNALCVYALCRRTFRDRPGTATAVGFLASLLLFSPMQWEAFLWAARAWSFLPFAALSAGLVVAGSRWSRASKLGAGGVLAAVVAASLPVGAASGDGPRAGLSALPALLGSPFSRTHILPPETLAPVAGGLLLASFLVLALLVVSSRSRTEPRVRALPWLAIGGLALLAGAALVLVVAPPRDVLLPRYTTIGLQLCVAVLPLFALVASDLHSRLAASEVGLRSVLEHAPAFGFGALLVVIGMGWLVGLEGMHGWKAARLRARTALIFLDRFAPAHHTHLGGDAGLDAVRVAAKTLDRHAQLRPPMADGEDLDPFTPGGALAPEHGELSSRRVARDWVEVRGFAWLAEQRRPADGVLLTVRVGDGPRRTVALAEVRDMPIPHLPEHDHIYNRARFPQIEERGAWAARVRRGALPQGVAFRIEAFAADAELLELRRLPGDFVVERSEDGLSARRENGES